MAEEEKINPKDTEGQTSIYRLTLSRQQKV